MRRRPPTRMLLSPCSNAAQDLIDAQDELELPGIDLLALAVGSVLVPQPRHPADGHPIAGDGLLAGADHNVVDGEEHLFGRRQGGLAPGQCRQGQRQRARGPHPSAHARTHVPVLSCPGRGLPRARGPLRARVAGRPLGRMAGASAQRLDPGPGRLVIRVEIEHPPHAPHRFLASAQEVEGHADVGVDGRVVGLQPRLDAIQVEPLLVVLPSETPVGQVVEQCRRARTRCSTARTTRAPPAPR